MNLIRRIRLVSGLIMFAFVVSHLLNHALGLARPLLTVYFDEAPWAGVRQGTVLAVAWVHGCIGLRYWLRLKPWYERAQPYLHAAALLVPVLALLGVLVAGKEVMALAQNPD